MKMDRNLNSDGKGKYALVLMRNLPARGEERMAALKAMQLLNSMGILDYGQAESPSEFFLIRLKDKYAMDALAAYADAVMADSRQEADEAKARDKYEWAVEVRRLVARAGELSPFCKQPD
jgi:hypothetical protein